MGERLDRGGDSIRINGDPSKFPGNRAIPHGDRRPINRVPDAASRGVRLDSWGPTLISTGNSMATAGTYLGKRGSMRWGREVLADDTPSALVASHERIPFYRRGLHRSGWRYRRPTSRALAGDDRRKLAPQANECGSARRYSMVVIWKLPNPNPVPLPIWTVSAK